MNIYSDKIKYNELLTIYIVTYNRSNYLGQTLDALAKSFFCNIPIVIMDNASTDNTIDVCNKKKEKFTDLRITTHRYNIGANANILRAIESCESVYCWIIADDDIFSFDDVDDVMSVLKEQKYKLVHVGGHSQEWNHGGQSGTPRELIKNGYPYFKFGSFIPSGIFKAEDFLENSLISGYNNIGNSYPHIPYLQYIYYENYDFYISKKRLITAGSNPGSYDSKSWILWWIRTADTMKSAIEKRNFFNSHYGHKLLFTDRLLIASAALVNFKNYLDIKSFFLRTSMIYSLFTVELYILAFLVKRVFSKLKDSKFWGVILYYKNKLK